MQSPALPPIRSIAAVSISSCTSLPVAISDAWPRKEKPVTSVQAWTRYCTITSRADLLSVVIRRIASALPSSDRRSAFSAVVRMPMPSGFCKNSASPGFAPEFVRTLSGWTKPVTASPYFGSSS